ncbi:MAG: hypothetical protein JWR18_2107, partial [Segetibacter sp.]|nr:hypothetical protein [Segetibacter sp.]
KQQKKEPGLMDYQDYEELKVFPHNLLIPVLSFVIPLYQTD